MKLCSHGLNALLGLGAVCGVMVAGHQHHGHEAETQIPLHEQEYVQDSAEELERKWSFEVRLKFPCLLYEVGQQDVVSRGWSSKYAHLLLYERIIPEFLAIYRQLRSIFFPLTLLMCYLG